MILVRFYLDNHVDVTVKQHNMAVMEVPLVLHMVANQLATQQDIPCQDTSQVTHHQVTCQSHIQVINSLVQTISKDDFNRTETVHFANFPKQNISSTANASIL